MMSSSRFPFALAAVISLSTAATVTHAAGDDPVTAPPTPAKTATATPPTAPTPAAKVVLRYKAQVGQTERVRGSASLDLAGAPVKVLVSQIDKLTFTKVDATSGDMTIDDLTEKADTTIGGETQSQEKPETTTYTIHPNGMLVSYKSPQADKDKDEAALDIRLHQATAVVFSDAPVGMGDKWSRDYKADTTLGTRDAHADFEIVATQQIAGVTAYKIKMTYAETGTAPITGKGTYLIETTSGDELSSDYEIGGMPLAGAVATGILHSERFEGGPFPASKNDVAAATADGKKEQTIDDKIKDGYEKIPGVVTLYRKSENGSDTIYAELREDQIGQLMMLQATASTGTAAQVVAGDVIDDLVFKFTRTTDDRLILTVPNFWFRATPGTPIAKSVRRSFADAFIQSFKIDAKQPDRKTVLINVSDFFKGDIAGVSSLFSTPSFSLLGGGGGGFGMDREKTYIATVKNFPDNLVVSTQYNFLHMGPRGDNGTLADSRSASILVTYNLFQLPVDANYQPTNGFKPRLADTRVGYFTGGMGAVGPNYMSFDDDSKEDPFVYYIEHWDLKKKDPTAAVSEPVKPITFWIDNAVPVEYREGVKGGLLAWNKAFEKLGYKNAIVVNQMPDNPDPKDPNVPTDTADMRFNMLRWVTSPAGGYAVSLMRANPLTGQILNASITVDANLVRYTKLEHKSLIDPVEAFNAAAGVNVEYARMKAAADARTAAQQAGSRGAAAMTSFANPLTLLGSTRFDADGCDMAEGMKEQAWFGGQALAAVSPGGMLSPADKKEYINQYIHEVVSHEMGHIMGLRHNFVASTQVSLADLSNPTLTQAEGLGASVMDYSPFNIMALHKKGVPYFSQTIGAYDIWAIQYGYTEIPSAKTPDEELPVLKQIASKSGVKGHAYASDEVADDFDPNVTRFDLSSDPIGYWQKMMDLSRYLLVNLDKREPKAGESYWEFTRAFNELVGTYAGGAGEASRYIGGLNVSRSNRGDVQEKPALQPIDVAKQKQALALMNTYLFAPDALVFPKRYYTELTTDPRGFESGDFPIQDEISRLQSGALKRLFSGMVLSRVANNEYKMGGDGTKALTLPVLFTSVGSNVWSEIDGHKNVPVLRRQLQRAYVDTMVDMVTEKSYVPDDARMLAWQELRSLKTRLESAEKASTSPTYDSYTKVHLAESLVKVNRALNAGIVLNAGGGGGGMNLMQLLMGGQTSNNPASTVAPPLAP